MALRLRLRIPEVQDPDFAADVVFGAEAVLRPTGNADPNAGPQLGELLATLHAELQTRALSVAVVDMSPLDAMAAGCFNALLAWLSRVQDLDAAARYQIRFRLNRSVPWQANTVRALSCFDTDLATIEA